MTGVIPRRPQVFDRGGLSDWPHSSSKTIQPPRAAAVLLSAARSPSSTPRWRRRHARWRGARPAGRSSRGGAAIGYRQLGRGPGIIVVHGSMSSGYNFLQLAEALADAFTVYLPDRRGRGLSGPYQPGDGIQQEADDLD